MEDISRSEIAFMVRAVNGEEAATNYLRRIYPEVVAKKMDESRESKEAEE